ncbi:MAG: glycoside hydrolase, partial [Synechococcaceae cyanobacterium]|nr:glycoside hydrolase [Synechococcaceae cyanobacterium]
MGAFRVRLDRRFQTIENFGASDCWSKQKIGAWSAESVGRVADLLFCRERGIGLSCWRFNAGAGVDPEAISNPWRTVESFETGEGTYDWCRQAGERRILREALKRGVPQYVLFANSPPRRLTRNGHANCSPDGHSTNLAPGAEDAFARYLVDIARHFRENPDPEERVPFGFVSPINEPEWDWLPAKQEGCRAANSDLKRILRALGRELERQGIEDVAPLAPESGSIPDMVRPNDSVSRKYGAPFGDYIREFADDDDMRRILANRLAYHSYWSDDPARRRADREALREAAERRPGLCLWQSEYCVMQGGRDLSMATALHAARIIHLDLTVVGVTAWQWWLA